MPNANLAVARVSLAQRAVDTVRGAYGAIRDVWMGPGTPVAPTAIEGDKPRQFDYQPGWNYSYLPRTEQSETWLKFDLLRAMAEPSVGGLDLARLCIETRKDQMGAQKWAIAGRDGTDGGQRARDIELKLRRPDGIHTYRQWQRMLVEEVNVTDAATIYALPDEEVAELIDGSTMKPYLGLDGRLPAPPLPAWSQVIRGIPVTYVDPLDGKKKPVTWTTDEVVAAVRNPRVYRAYGMSPIEQIIGILNVALNRQTYLSSFFTAGNIPDAFVIPAKASTPDQIKTIQQWLDAMEGDIISRRRLRVLPDGASITFSRDQEHSLKSDVDDYLNSLVCYAFSVSRQSLIKQMNRSSATQSAESADLEGLEPLKLWWKDLMDEVLEKVFGETELEYVFLDEEIPDPLKKAEVASLLVAAKVVTPKYIADEWYGFPEDAVPDPATMAPAPPGDGAPVPPGGGGPAASVPPLPGGGPTPAALEKKKARARRVPRAVVEALQAYLTAQRKAVVSALRSEKLAKVSQDEIDALMAGVSAGDKKKLLDEIQPYLEDLAAAGAEVALADVGVDVKGLLDQANDDAVAWAEDRAAGLVGMRVLDDGTVIPNPNVDWQIDETTRGGIRGLVSIAERDGWSNDRLAEELGDSYLFSDSRAEMIARTETAFADVEGNRIGWRNSGVVSGQRWLLSEDPCPECEENGAAGVIPLDDEFPNGGPPAHPNCRCDVEAVLAEEGE